MEKVVSVIISILLLMPLGINAQGKGKVCIEADFGANANFFVRSYDEVYTPGGVAPLYLYKKNMIGTAGGVELKYGISKRAAFIMAYTRTVNSKRRSGGVLLPEFQLLINDFNLRHINNLFMLGYDRPLLKNSSALRFNVGALYLTSQQQEIEAYNLPTGEANKYTLAIKVQDRNKKNSGIEEAGVFAGLSYQKTIGDKFDLGIKTRGYYLISAGTFEGITLTPFLLYRF